MAARKKKAVKTKSPKADAPKKRSAKELALIECIAEGFHLGMSRTGHDLKPLVFRAVQHAQEYLLAQEALRNQPEPVKDPSPEFVEYGNQEEYKLADPSAKHLRVLQVLKVPDDQPTAELDLDTKDFAGYAITRVFCTRRVQTGPAGEPGRGFAPLGEEDAGIRLTMVTRPDQLGGHLTEDGLLVVLNAVEAHGIGVDYLWPQIVLGENDKVRISLTGIPPGSKGLKVAFGLEYELSDEMARLVRPGVTYVVKDGRPYPVAFAEAVPPAPSPAAPEAPVPTVPTV